MVQFSKILVPIIKEKSIFAYLKLNITVQGKDAEAFEKVQQLHPVIMDAMFTDLYGALADLWIPNKDPTPEVIHYRLQRILDRVLGEGLAKPFVSDLYLLRVH